FFPNSASRAATSHYYPSDLPASHPPNEAALEPAPVNDNEPSKTADDAATLPLSPATRPDQDGFVVARADAHFWDGVGWTQDRTQAQAFKGTPDPWADAHAVIAPLRAAGTFCREVYCSPLEE